MIVANGLQTTRYLIEQAEKLLEEIKLTRNTPEQTKNRLSAVHFFSKLQAFRVVAGARNHLDLQLKNLTVSMITAASSEQILPGSPRNQLT